MTMNFERIFQVVAAALAAVAAYFYWVGNNDAMYVSAVMGCVAFFLSIRSQVKKRNDEREAQLLSEERSTDPPASNE